MPNLIRLQGDEVDLSQRVSVTAAVAGSPATNEEHIIATLTVPTDVTRVVGIVVQGFAAFTVGTSGTAARLRIRQTNVAGTVVADTGATTGGIAATNVVDVNVAGVDANAVSTPQTYVLTLQITGGAAASTVSAVQLLAIQI